MVTPMTDQPGRDDPSDRQGSDRQGSGRQGSDRPASGRAGSGHPASDRQGSGRGGSDRQWPATPADMLSDLQRWLLRSSAKSMRKEIGGQVRKTFGGGRSETSDVWDTATTEIPPEVGEAPECQWCPICRAARRMRESGPGVGGQLSGVGDAVASAVQDALGALDSMLARTGERDGADRGAANWDPAVRDLAERSISQPRPTVGPQDSGGQASGGQASGAEQPGTEEAAAGDWEPGISVASTGPEGERDIWGSATGSDGDATEDGQPDGPGHEPDDRG